ncbi:uncharacterized protein G2W53_028556 [Senna tora]|uniref:Uncharacterized protein n=1 Tax=Senna tora TaxID=362788 RepID=A0A834T3R6_9FABA|nr:uncharacterized protein G2W53_028556 [Senna tora]
MTIILEVEEEEDEILVDGNTVTITTWAEATTISNRLIKEEVVKATKTSDR